jgi:hypothetical protein
MIAPLIALLVVIAFALWRLSRPSLDELIKRGKFDYIDLTIRSETNWSNREGTTGVTSKSYLLVRIDGQAYRSDVDRRLELVNRKRALRTVRHATLRDLAAYAGDKDGWNGQGLIFALGSVYVGPAGRPQVPILWGNESDSARRTLGMGLNTGNFSGGECVLLVVE